MTARLDCAAARAAIHAALDVPGMGLDARTRAHVAACGACRELADGLAELTAVLAGVPPLAFPADDLAAVWRRTIDAEHARPTRPHPRARRRTVLVARAAAFLAFAALGAWAVVTATREPEPGPAEIARAASDLQYVLRLAGHALDKGREVAVEDAVRRPFAYIPLRPERRP